LIFVVSRLSLFNSIIFQKLLLRKPSNAIRRKIITMEPFPHNNNNGTHVTSHVYLWCPVWRSLVLIVYRGSFNGLGDTFYFFTLVLLLYKFKGSCVCGRGAASFVLWRWWRYGIRPAKTPRLAERDVGASVVVCIVVGYP